MKINQLFTPIAFLTIALGATSCALKTEQQRIAGQAERLRYSTGRPGIDRAPYGSRSSLPPSYKESGLLYVERVHRVDIRPEEIRRGAFTSP